MVQQSAWSSDQQVHPLLELVGFGFPIRSSHHDRIRLSMVLHEIPRDVERLEGKLPRRSNDDDPRA